jgi:chromosome segregation ATPase
MSRKRQIVKKRGKKRAKVISPEHRKADDSKKRVEPASCDKKAGSPEKEKRPQAISEEDKTALLMRVIEELKRRVEAESSLKEDLLKSAQEVRKENERLRRELLSASENEKVLDELLDDMLELKKKNSSLRKRLATLQKRKSSLKNLNKEYMETLARAKEKIKSRDQKIESLETELGYLLEDMVRLKERFVSLKRDHDRNVAEREEQFKELEKSRSEIASMNIHIEEMEKELMRIKNSRFWRLNEKLRNSRG